MKAHYEQGLTLIELLITFAIITIAVTIGTSSFSWIMERSQAAATRNNIERAFSLARYTAVTEQTIVTICPLNSSNKCSSNWSLPTFVFRDPDSNLELDDTSKIIKEFKLASAGQLTPSNSFNGPRRYFQYRPDGSVRGTLGNLTWCSLSGNDETAVHVRVNLGGRLTWSRDSNGNGIVETASGNDVRC